MPEADLRTSEAVLPKQPTTGRAVPIPGLDRIPWWAIILLIAGLITGLVILTNADYRAVVQTLSNGLMLTLYLCFISYLFALLFGLVAGLMRVSRNPLIYTVGTLYVEVIRGIPLLVLILYVFYVIGPVLANTVGERFAFIFRDEATEAIIALSVGYGAYLAEVFRAGIESISRGQMEAARSLGMSNYQAMRFVILPQAIRTVLPPLGNDFISMLKDSALTSAIGVKELTLLAKNRGAATFQFLLYYTMAAILYLVLTLGLSLIVRYIERRFAIPK